MLSPEIIIEGTSVVPGSVIILVRDILNTFAAIDSHRLFWSRLPRHIHCISNEEQSLTTEVIRSIYCAVNSLIELDQFVAMMLYERNLVHDHFVASLI